MLILIIYSFSVIDNSNNSIIQTFNVIAENIFETKTEKHYLSTSVQMPMYLKGDDCYAKDKTGNLPYTDSSYLDPVKEELTTFKDNDNDKSHNTDK